MALPRVCVFCQSFVFDTPFDLSWGLVVSLAATADPAVGLSMNLVDYAGRQTTTTNEYLVTRGFQTTDFAFVMEGGCTDKWGRVVNVTDQTTCEIVVTGNQVHSCNPHG